MATEQAANESFRLLSDEIRIGLRSRQVSSKQPAKEILAMNLETATGLLEDWYCHPDLLEESTASAGGVTPVVTQPTAGTA